MRHLLLIAFLIAPLTASAQTAADETTVQARIVLTVAESKRLIARAVADLPEVKRALAEGMVIICKGTTNTYVAEEILGERIPHGAYIYGRVTPSKGPRVPKHRPIPEIILIKGVRQQDLAYADAVKKLKPHDVVIKGGNVLDYDNQLAGVCIGAPDGGTTGKFMPYLVPSKAHLIIPIGLEKQVAHNLLDISAALRAPTESLNSVPSLFLLTGKIITEIEALHQLADCKTTQIGSGGVAGAEGTVHLLCQGPRYQVQKALDLTTAIQGEPPFVTPKPPAKK